MKKIVEYDNILSCILFYLEYKLSNLHDNISGNYFIEVSIAGKSIDFGCLISSLEFDASTNGEASICIIRWVSECYKNNELFLNENFDSAQIGAKFEVSAGSYNSEKNFAKIFSGFIFSSSIDIQKGVSYLEISGMDAKMWMMANKFTQFKSSEQTYSKIIKDVQSKYSSKFSGAYINISGEPASIRPGLHQYNESDFDYLKRIADIIGSFFYILDGKFMFTPIEANKSEEIIIEPICKITDENLLKKVTFVSNIIGIPKSVSANFTKDEDYKNNISSDINSLKKIGTGNTADELTSNISDNNIIKIFDNSINSPDSAKFISNAEYSKRAINLAKCEVVSSFLPNAKIGAPAQMLGFGNIIDNNYIITSLNHKYDGKNFVTSLELSSDAFSQ